MIDLGQGILHSKPALGGSKAAEKEAKVEHTLDPYTGIAPSHSFYSDLG